MNIKFKKKSFFFKLLSKINNSRQSIFLKKGWIIKLINQENHEGFGEVSPLCNSHIYECEKQLNQIPSDIDKNNLLEIIKKFNPCVQSGINSALAELEGELKFKENYNFNHINQSAILLNSESVLRELEILKKNESFKKEQLTIKCKVAIYDNKIEEKLLEEILNMISSNIRLRIDANGSWNKNCAYRWAEILKDSKNLDWLEQPLHVDDIEGLKELGGKIPVALDESLIKYPNLHKSWGGWQIRRPSQESNPLKLQKELNEKSSFRSISSSFETGIGRRMLYHFSNLQLLGPTPKVPGLALKQTPKNSLFVDKPSSIWEHL